MIERKPEDHLFGAVYKFTYRQLQGIVEEFVMHKTGIPNVDFSLGIDDEDNQARITFWQDDIPEEIWDVLAEKIPYIEEDYSLPQFILGDYMHASVQEVKGYHNGWGSPDDDMNFYVEVQAKNYIEHANIHQWGF